MTCKTPFLFVTACVLSVISFAQIDALIVPGNIRLPRDKSVKKQLLSSLNAFLAAAEGNNDLNTYVLPVNQLETYVLLDEIRGLGVSRKYKDENFYKARLGNAAQLDDTTFLCQVAYLGVNKDTPLLRATITLSARKNGDHFYFYAPLRQHTALWHHENIQGTAVYYKHGLNRAQANAYFGMIARYDKKLGAASVPTDFYCADNFPEAMQLVGLDYKSDYNGYRHNTMSASGHDHALVVNGSLTADFTRFDPHDLWHDRLHRVLSTNIINRPVDEGTAYLYGGSWGFTWQEILEKFKTYAKENRDADWLALYNQSKNFDEKGKYPLNVDFVINALLAEKIEKEKGFSAVVELLSCGKKETDNENYFKALNKITGITKTNFNKQVRKLIEQS